MHVGSPLLNTYGNAINRVSDAQLLVERLHGALLSKYYSSSLCPSIVSLPHCFHPIRASISFNSLFADRARYRPPLWRRLMPQLGFEGLHACWFLLPASLSPTTSHRCRSWACCRHLVTTPDIMTLCILTLPSLESACYECARGGETVAGAPRRQRGAPLPPPGSGHESFQGSSARGQGASPTRAAMSSGPAEGDRRRRGPHDGCNTVFLMLQWLIGDVEVEIHVAIGLSFMWVDFMEVFFFALHQHEFDVAIALFRCCMNLNECCIK